MRVNFKIKLKAENLKNNAYAEVLSIVKGEKIFYASANKGTITNIDKKRST